MVVAQSFAHVIQVMSACLNMIHSVFKNVLETAFMVYALSLVIRQFGFHTIASHETAW